MRGLIWPKRIRRYRLSVSGSRFARVSQSVPMLQGLLQRNRCTWRKPTVRKLSPKNWLPIFAMGLSGCASNGKVVLPPPECPKPPIVSADLMQSPTTEQKVRAELFELPLDATHK